MLALLLCAGATSAARQLQLGVHTLLDGALLAATSPGVGMELGRPVKDFRPAVVREYPWEATLGFYSSTVTVPPALSGTGRTQWRLFYTCNGPGVLFFDPISYCVAVSDDAGETWTKPSLSFYPWTANGTQPGVPTNIVFVTQANTFSGSVFVDGGPDVPPEGPFALVFEASVGDRVRLPYIARSLDGFAFESWAVATARWPMVNVTAFADTSFEATWDGSGGGSYVAIGRDEGVDHGTTRWCNGTAGSHRIPSGVVQRCGGEGPPCSAGNASAWSPATPAPLFTLGAPDDDQCLDMYNMPALRLPPDAAFAGASSWVGLPSMFRHIPQAQSGAPIPRAAQNDGFMDVRLLASRDGRRWGVPPGARDAFLSRGVGVRDPASGLYNGSGSDVDAGFIFVSNNGLIDPADGDDAGAEAHPWLTITHWGGQSTHAGGGAYMYQQPGAFAGLLRARLRREGWTALSTPRAPSGDAAGTGSGWATTALLALPPGPLRLLLNADIDAAGNLTLALQDAGTGAALPGFGHADCLPLRGNGVRQAVVWGGDRSTWVGGSPLLPTPLPAGGLVFNFTLTHARLYSWEVRAGA